MFVTGSYLVSIWHMDPETETKIYVSNLILSCFYKAVVYLQIVKVRVHLIPGPTWFLSGIWIQKLKRKNMFQTGSYPVCIRQLSPCKYLRKITSATRPYLVPIWHMDPEIKMPEYVFNRILSGSNLILSGFHKAVVDLKIVKLKVHLLPTRTWLLPHIWIQKLKCKNMFLTGSYPVSIRQLCTCKLLSQITFATRPYLVHIWHMDLETETKIYVSNRIQSGFHKAVVDLKIIKPNYICYSALPGSYLAYGSRN